MVAPNQPKPSGMIVTRHAQVSDHRFLEQLHHAAYREVVTRQFGSWNEPDQDAFFEQSLREADFHIVELDGAPVGAIGVRQHPDHIALAEMQILPEYQNEGIGSELLRMELERAANLGLPVRLRVLRQNRARALYARSGFVLEGETDTHALMIWHPGTAPALSEAALGFPGTVQGRAKQ